MTSRSSSSNTTELHEEKREREEEEEKLLREAHKMLAMARRKIEAELFNPPQIGGHHLFYYTFCSCKPLYCLLLQFA